MDAESWQKEQVSVAYLWAIATQNGFTISRSNVDKDGVDATLDFNGVGLDVQLKCTHSPDYVGDIQTFDLDVVTYDKLRARARSAPGYLFVVTVPKDLQTWIVHDPEQIVLACRGLWAKIQNQPPAKGSVTKTIHLPKTQRIDAEALKQMHAYALHRVLHGALADEAA